MGYAEHTAVPVDRSRAEIERTLAKYGATRFGTMMEPGGASIYFEVNGRQIQLRVPMPPREDKQFTAHRGRSTWGRRVSEAERNRRYEQEFRRRGKR